MKNDTKIIRFNFAIGLILAISAFLYFRFAIPNHLFFKEQIQLFLFNPGYFLSYFSKPGGVACLTGDFLTQFLYLKNGGAITLVTVLMLEWLLIIKTLKLFLINQVTSLFALFPVIAEWIVCGSLSFSIAMSMAFIFTLFIFWIYTGINNRIVSVIAGLIFIPVLYFLAGGAMLLFPVLALLYDIGKGRRSIFYWLGMFALAGILPLAERHYFLLTPYQAYIYPFLNLYNESSAFALIGIASLSCFKSIRNPLITIQSFSVTLILILVMGITGLCLSTNRKQEIILGMASDAHRQNWEKILKTAEKTKLSDDIVDYYTYMALSNQSQLGDRLLEFYRPNASGLFLNVDPKSNEWLPVFLSNDVYFYLGDMNMAHHYAMQGLVSSPYQRSSALVERLIEINLANNDIPLAMKYIRMLESTWMHKKQASFLKKTIMEQNESVKDKPENKPALDYLLCHLLLKNDISGFFDTYSRCCKGKNVYIPKMYAEALLIYFKANKIKPEKMTDYTINQDYITAFGEFAAMSENADAEMDELHEKFSGTYWLYHHLTTMTP